MDAEERVRRQAVRRVMAGERAGEVAAALGRTERWVFKWLSRYDPFGRRLGHRALAGARARAGPQRPEARGTRASSPRATRRAALVADRRSRDRLGAGEAAHAEDPRAAHDRAHPRTRRHAAAGGALPLRGERHAVPRGNGATRAEPDPGGGPGRAAPPRRRDPLLRLQRRRRRPARRGPASCSPTRPMPKRPPRSSASGAGSASRAGSNSTTG